MPGTARRDGRNCAYGSIRRGYRRAPFFFAGYPDVCVIDINLPMVSGFELARRILARDVSARIIMFSMNDDPVVAVRAIEIGAKGFVSKSGDPDHLAEAIRQVGRGETYRATLPLRGRHAHSQLSKLTAKEMELLRLLSAGRSLKEIAGPMAVARSSTATAFRHAACLPSVR
jgi:two-component system, NarL family, invasion response regulator UvrY